MTVPYILLLIFVFLLILIGLVGTLIPVLPGAPLIFSAILIYAIFTNFREIDAMFLLMTGGLAAVPLVLHYALVPLSARKLGASKWGAFGAFIGAVVGLFVLAPFGIFLLAFLGAVLMEFVATNNSGRSLKAGCGSFLGFMVGGIIHFVIGIAITVLFIFRIV